MISRNTIFGFSHIFYQSNCLLIFICFHEILIGQQKWVLDGITFFVKSCVEQLNPNWHEAGHFYPPCNFGIGFCQLNLYQKFRNFFGGEN